jgi:hypothetical protein
LGFGNIEEKRRQNHESQRRSLNWPPGPDADAPDSHTQTHL